MIPLSLPGCQHSPTRTETQFRFQNLGASVRVQNNNVDKKQVNCSTNYNNYNNFSYKNDSVNTYKSFCSSILLPPLPLPLSSSTQLKCVKSFFCQNLNCIEENESLELFEEKRDVQMKLKCLPTFNAKQKRQSEPNIRCSFVNRGFEAATINVTQKFPSQNDIAEVSFDDTMGVDWKKLKPKCYNEKSHRTLRLTKPKITINNVFGEEINHKLESSDSLDSSPDTINIVVNQNYYHNHHQNQQQQLQHQNNHCKMRNIIREPSIDYDSNKVDDVYDNLKEDINGDGLNNIVENNGDDDDEDDMTVYENIKMCRKCGHKSLNL